MIIFKQNSFVYKPKAFWMLHLNDHFVYKTHVCFRAVNFGVAPQASHTYTFSQAFTIRILYNYKYWVFHQRRNLSHMDTINLTFHHVSWIIISICI